MLIVKNEFLATKCFYTVQLFSAKKYLFNFLKTFSHSMAGPIFYTSNEQGSKPNSFPLQRSCYYWKVKNNIPEKKWNFYFCKKN